MADFGNRVVKGKIHGIAYDDSQLSADEAAAAKPSLMPRTKVVSATAGAALVSAVVAVLGLAGVEVPEEVVIAVTPLVALLFGYVKKD